MNERSKMNMSHLMAAGVFLFVSALVLWVSVLITSKSEAEQESHTEAQQIESAYASEEINLDIPEEVLREISLETALEQTLNERMMRIVPGDYYTFEWKLLDTAASDSFGTAYGLLLFYSHSGSPLIYSEKAGQYTAAIYSSYLLPVAVSYQQDQSGRYAVTDVWEPSQTNYEEDVRACFPKEAAEDILQNLNTYAVASLEADGYAPDAAEIEVFSEGPIWPTYYFHEELDDGVLCGLADYYGGSDIYTEPVRGELYSRFFQNPQRMLNALGDCKLEVQATICGLLSEQSADSRFPRDGVEGLTQNGQKCYAEILNKAGVSQNVFCTYLMNDGTDIYIIRMIDLFEDVLFRNGEFTQVTSTSSGEVSLSELYKEGTELEMLKGHRHFAIIDLDDDGTAEVVLPLAVGDRQTPYGFEILHYHDNKIQGYTMMYREFCGLKTDGTFVVSGGANDWAICSVDSFSQECCNVTKHLWCKSSENDKGVFSVEYFWEGETVGEDIFLGRATSWEQMDEVVFHEFSAWDEIVY